MNYSELTLHYFQTAVAAGVLTGPDVYRGAAGSRARGTWVQFDVQVASGIIRAARFLAFACPHTIAVAAWVAEHAVGHGLQAALPESVENLSDRQRTVFLLRFVEEMELKEIAAATGMGEGTVKAHLSRALSRVRKEFGERQ